MNNTISQLLDELLHIIYPNICVSCEQEDALTQDVFCLYCKSDLPFTNSFSRRDNFLEQKLLGRIKIEAGAYLFHFYKEGKVQEAMHKFKYNGLKNIGSVLGRQFGQNWQESPGLDSPDFIIPVPIYFKKKAKRGYNQSNIFAMGISDILGTPVLSDCLVKKHATESQTKKSRLERIENIKHSFSLRQAKKIEGKHILLVDDVLTTGATIECCAQSIQESVDCKISIGTIALAQN